MSIFMIYALGLGVNPFFYVPITPRSQFDFLKFKIYSVENFMKLSHYIGEKTFINLDSTYLTPWCQ